MRVTPTATTHATIKTILFKHLAIDAEFTIGNGSTIYRKTGDSEYRNIETNESLTVRIIVNFSGGKVPLLEKIAGRLTGLNRADMTTSERQIAKLLVEAGYIQFDDNDDLIES